MVYPYICHFQFLSSVSYSFQNISILPFWLGVFPRYFILSDEVEFFRVDFTVKINDEVALFSNKPIKITDAFSKDCLDALEQLKNLCLYSNDNILKMQKVLQLFEYLCINLHFCGIYAETKA